MKMVNRNEELMIISHDEYKRWREDGMAFVEFEYDYSKPNFLMLSGTFSSL